MVTEEDEPATYLNVEIMDKFRPILEPFYYDETKFDTYLEQLGIEYPVIKLEQSTKSDRDD